MSFPTYNSTIAGFATTDQYYLACQVPMGYVARRQNAFSVLWKCDISSFAGKRLHSGWRMA